VLEKKKIAGQQVHLVDLSGKVVGITNLYNMQAGMSGSIPLSKTPICQRS